MDNNLVTNSWTSRSEFTAAWHELGRLQNKKLIVDPSKKGGRSVVIICSSCVGFRLKVRCTSNQWCVSEVGTCLDHYNLEEGLKYPCTGTWAPSSKDIAGSELYQAMAKSIPKAGGKRSLPIESQVDMLSTAGLSASIDVVKKAKHLTEISGDEHVRSLRLLEPLLFATQQLNPGLRYRLRTENNEFHGVFVIMPYTKCCLPHCLDILGLDSSHMKPVCISRSSSTYLKKMCIHCIAGRTPANEMIIYAFAMTFSENSNDLSELINYLSEEGITLNTARFAVFSDRGQAVLKSIRDSMSNCLQMLCYHHLEGNLKKYGTSLKMLKQLSKQRLELHTRSAWKTYKEVGKVFISIFVTLGKTGNFTRQ